MKVSPAAATARGTRPVSSGSRRRHPHVAPEQSREDLRARHRACAAVARYERIVAKCRPPPRSGSSRSPCEWIWPCEATSPLRCSFMGTTARRRRASLGAELLQRTGRCCRTLSPRRRAFDAVAAGSPPGRRRRARRSEQGSRRCFASGGALVGGVVHLAQERGHVVRPSLVRFAPDRMAGREASAALMRNSLITRTMENAGLCGASRWRPFPSEGRPSLAHWC